MLYPVQGGAVDGGGHPPRGDHKLPVLGLRTTRPKILKTALKRKKISNISAAETQRRMVNLWLTLTKDKINSNQRVIARQVLTVILQ